MSTYGFTAASRARVAAGEAGTDRRAEKRSAEERLERSLMLRLEAFMSRRSPAFVVTLGFLLIALIGLIDAVTGSFDMAPLYIVPVALVTFARGRWLGAILALVATITRGAAEVASSVADLQSSVTYWSGLTRFYVFMVVVLLVGPMRDALRWQREVAEKLSATNAHLMALNELRRALVEHHEARALESTEALDELQVALEELGELSKSR